MAETQMSVGREVTLGENLLLTDYPITMLPCSLEPILEQPPELSIMITIHTSEYLHILQWEFKRGGFESNIPGGVRQHEPKVNMYQVTCPIQQDVSVVSILDL